MWDPNISELSGGRTTESATEFGLLGRISDPATEFGRSAENYLFFAI